MNHFGISTISPDQRLGCVLTRQDGRYALYTADSLLLGFMDTVQAVLMRMARLDIADVTLVAAPPPSRVVRHVCR